MLPRDDVRQNPFMSYDFYKGYCPDDNNPDYCPDDIDDNDRFWDDLDYIWEQRTNK